MTPQPPRRTSSSMPKLRKISIERVLTPVARGKIDVEGWRSTTSERTPWRARPIAVTSPAGPAPMMRTGTSSAVAVVVGCR